ncbi:MAG TPA: helix-turn-helix domain-containing protein [Acidimicrobiales bacterium]|nr:helix-turn-helix domain-containing protein [Acidimicrobiales bacterium]
MSPSRSRREATHEEARALVNPLRMRILRLCLDEALTNKELAVRLDKDPGTLLYHVRMLVDTGFLAPEPVRSGAHGALEKPYRATGKSWTVEVLEDEGGMQRAMVDAFRAELAETPSPSTVLLSRLGLRLRPKDKRELRARLEALIEDFSHRSDPAGEPWALFVGFHRRAANERGG